jgi:hypothetical protein
VPSRGHRGVRSKSHAKRSDSQESSQVTDVRPVILLAFPARLLHGRKL